MSNKTDDKNIEISNALKRYLTFDTDAASIKYCGRIYKTQNEIEDELYPELLDVILHDTVFMANCQFENWNETQIEYWIDITLTQAYDIRFISEDEITECDN